MRLHLIFIILIGLVMLAFVVTAAPIPDSSSSISSSNSVDNWIVVNHQTLITIVANNMTSGPIAGATVSMALNSTTLGSLVMNGLTTDGTGQVNGTFTAGTKPGDVNITATITYIVGGTPYTVQETYTQKIDHDIPYNAVYTYNSPVSVDSLLPFNISYTDIWGNPIDNRNPNDPDSITMHISSVSNHAEFDLGNGTYTQDTTLQLNPYGNISVNVLTDMDGGENIIQIAPFGNIGITFKTIIGLTNGVPFSISQAVSPDNPASLPADGSPDHIFSFVYTLFDQFGNIAQNQPVQVQTSWPGDLPVNMTTNAFGQILFNYGPHVTAGNVTVTVTSFTNTSVSASQVIQYYSTAPANMVFTANPDIMPSLDSKAGQTSTLIAKVTDIMGNPVANQTVSFSMGVPSYVYSPCVITGPKLLNTSAITDGNGNAIVTFIPGSFDTNKANVTYDPSDTGNVTIMATWSTIQQPVQVSWKNYPYLSVQTTLIPAQVGVNNTVDVTISLSADGWNLTGHPADVVIVTDLAGGIGGAGRLANTQASEIGFIKNATNDTYISLVSFGDTVNPVSPFDASTDTENKWKLQIAHGNWTEKLFNPVSGVWDYDLVDPADWVGLLSGSSPDCFNPTNGPGQPCSIITTTGSPYVYLNPYSDAQIDASLMNAGNAYPANQNELISIVNNYNANANGGTDYAAGINEAINELNIKGNPTHNQTIIIMGDGLNMMAPISPNSTESYWPSDWYPRASFDYIDESDFGKAAGTASALLAQNKGITVYGIGFPTVMPAGPEIDTPFWSSMVTGGLTGGCYYYAPDPTTMTSIFQQIEGKIQTTAGVNTYMVLNFQNLNVTYNNVSTMTNGSAVFNYDYVPNLRTSITDQTGNTSYINQTAQWDQNQTLIFNVGTMTTGQTWSTTFRLQVNAPGAIDMFGNPSAIDFNTGESEPLPDEYLMSIYNLTNTGMTMPAIQISNLQISNSSITDFVPLQWNITYPGSQTAYESIYYSTSNNPYNWQLIQNLPPVSPGTWPQSYSWDIRGMMAVTYYIEVTASAVDATPDTQILSTPLVFGAGSKAYIKLE
jgi:hypothetical protein